MNDHQDDGLDPARRFRVASIEKTDPPENVSGGEWYRYTIGHQASPIEGIRSGSLRSVKQHLEEYVNKLNARAIYGYSTKATRNIKI